MKLILSIFGLIALGCPAMADKLGPAGCGLGNMFMGTDSQVIASTTNGTSGSQTFGISSGTSNCNQPGRMAKLNNFIMVNQVALSNDVARGEGEAISGLADLLGCQDSSLLGSTLKSSYGELFSRPEISSMELSSGVKNVIQKNSALAQSCKNT